VEREELMNKDRALARERPRKAKDGTSDRAEREEFKNQGQESRQREKGRNKRRKSDGPRGREGGMDKEQQGTRQSTMENGKKSRSTLQGRGGRSQTARHRGRPKKKAKQITKTQPMPNKHDVSESLK